MNPSEKNQLLWNSLPTNTKKQQIKLYIGPTSGDTGHFGASTVLGPHHAMQELYINSVDYQNKHNEKWDSSRQKTEAELYGERETIAEEERAEVKDEETDSELKLGSNSLWG